MLTSPATPLPRQSNTWAVAETVVPLGILKDGAFLTFELN